MSTTRKRGDGSCYRYEYDAMDHRIRTIDPLGNVFATPHDMAGRLEMEIHPNTYDPETRSGQGVRYEYDTDNARIRVIYPDGGIRRLKYDAMGNLVKVIERSSTIPKQMTALDIPTAMTQLTGWWRSSALMGRWERSICTACAAWWVKEISADGYLAGETG